MEGKKEEKKKRASPTYQKTLKTDESSGKKVCKSEDAPEHSHLTQFFTQYAKQLDNKHDRRERIIKASRDITNASKKVIFTLHRVSIPNTSNEAVLKEADEALVLINKHIQKVVDEVQEETEYWRHVRSFGWGLQEWVEAVSFRHYLMYGKLITLQEVNELLPNCGKDFSCSEMDYILGIADLTGELMRLCINTLTNGNREQPFEICQFLRDVARAFEVLKDCYDIKKKMGAMRQSLAKVERVCYSIHVRGSEYPKEILLDMLKNESAGPSGEDQE